MRTAWLTDIHLNFLSPRGASEFLRSVARQEPDIVLVGGDIGEAGDVEKYLWVMAEVLRRPIYFVLGNHDFYKGSIAEVRSRVSYLCRKLPNLTWLSEAGVVRLSETTALVGHDSWADGRYGDFDRSSVMLNDYLLINELKGLGKLGRLRMLNQLGDQAADYLRKVLSEAIASHANVILLTHVPPFRESCWYDGQVSNDDHLPHFACKAVGEVLLEIMRNRFQGFLTVLCGHTHGAGTAQILPNLLVRTGGAQYGAPVVQDIFQL